MRVLDCLGLMRLGIETDVACCVSCHEDADLGYADLEDVADAVSTLARVCCAMLRALDTDYPDASVLRRDVTRAGAG